MVKKTYIQPKVLIVNVRTTHMISSSITGTNVGLENGGYTSGGDITITEGAAKSNNYSVWENDWNE